MSKLTKLIEQMEEAKRAFRESGLDLIKQEAKEFFEKYPEIKAVSWTQYAPYFNDGEACEFSVHEIYAATGIADDEDEEDSFDPEEHDPEEFFDGLHYGESPGMVNQYETLVHAGAKKFTDLLSGIPEDIMRDLFGDDSKVIITKDGVIIAEYEHHD